MIYYASVAIVEDNYPAELSLLSNHPIFFERIDAYKVFLIIKVTFSPITPKDTTYKKPKMKPPRQSRKIPSDNILESVLTSDIEVDGVG